MPRNSLAPLLAAALAVACGSSWANAEAGKLKARACTVCHGPMGIATLPQAPNIAGQPEGYLVEQLKAYRSGRRANEMMALMAKPLSDEDIVDLAAWFASIKVEVKTTP